MERVLGIDLGTTNCCVAVWEGNAPRVLQNRQGYKTTPSVLAITDEGKRLVGQLAARQAVTNPENTVSATKRLLGRRFDSPEVQHALKRSGYKIVAGPEGDARVVLGGTTYKIPEISAMLLQEMRVVAEEELGTSIDKAVVTVPAYFNDNQRQAVRDAGRIAGLDVVRIINEPTAAALAYGYRRGQDKTVAVYDLGGGTFDISVVKITADGEFRVIATTGDSYLGGEDFDNRIIEWLIRGFQAQTNVDLRGSPIALQRLRTAAQKAKCELSDVDEAEINLPFIVSAGPEGPLHMDYSIGREILEKLTADLVERTLTICDVAVGQAGINPRTVDDVLLVGGMTRMPAVQRAVRDYFAKTPSKNVHPDEVVALGAAIQGAAITEEADGVVLHDVTAHSLGIRTAGDRMERLIIRNTGIPTRCERDFTTNRDGQTSVQIVVLQGDSPTARDNEPLGQFALTDLRPASAGEISIRVAFEIDADGIFKVSATNLETGADQSIEVIPQGGLGDEELARGMADREAEDAGRREARLKEESKQRVEVLLNELSRLITRVQPMLAHSEVGKATVGKARQVVDHVRGAMTEKDDLTMEADLLERVTAALQKLVAQQ